jgi:phage gpG-like protein
MIIFTAENLDTVYEYISAISDGINELKENHLGMIAETVKKDIDERFKTGGRGTWSPISKMTGKRKQSDKVLIDSGTMRNSVSDRLSYNSVEVFVPYGGRNRKQDVPATHQYGLRGMPKRRIIDASSEALLSSLDKIMMKVISEILDGVV